MHNSHESLTINPGAVAGMAENVHALDSDFARMFPIISADEMRVCYVPINDVNDAARSEWLASVFGGYESCPFSAGDVGQLSSGYSDCQVLVVGGNDARRISAAYRRGRAMLRGGLAVCLMCGSSAPGRAKLLALGFDDVMDIDRVSPLEGIARIRTHWRRYKMQKSRS